MAIDIELLLMSVQAQLNELRSQIDDIEVRLGLAMNLPRPGAGQGESDSYDSSFMIVSQSVTDGVGTVTIGRGNRNLQGTLNVAVAETEIGGLGTSKQYIVLRSNRLTDEVDIVAEAVEPSSDDGTFFRRVLWEAQVEGGVLTLFDRRSDVNYGAAL